MSAAPAPPTAPPQANTGRLVSRFNVAFSLMSLIPLLTCFYLITVRFYSLDALIGINGVYFLLALVIAMLGLLAGHQLIRGIVRQLVAANAKLARLYDQQASFVSNVAHEFRSPLAVFKSALDNLADGLHGPLAADQQEPIHMCRREATRLARLVSDLLDLARIDTGKLTLQRRLVDVREVLRNVGRLLQGLAQERGLALSLELPDEPVTVFADPDRLQQVCINLLSNAIKFTARGSVAVRLMREPETVRVEIVDTGPGIAAEDQERIFDKFERVGHASEEGSGLGLPIARDIVELHGGRVTVESELGMGSRFIVRLPAALTGRAEEMP